MNGYRYCIYSKIIIKKKNYVILFTLEVSLTLCTVDEFKVESITSSDIVPYNNFYYLTFVYIIIMFI